MKLHYKQEMKYLNAVAEYLVSLGYHVEAPDTKHRDLLDVWGTYKGKRCYCEIYVTIYASEPEGNHMGGISGIWSQGDNEPEELFLSNDETAGLDTRFAPMHILDGLKPFKKGRIK